MLRNLYVRGLCIYIYIYIYIYIKPRGNTNREKTTLCQIYKYLILCPYPPQIYLIRKHIDSPSTIKFK